MQSHTIRQASLLASALLGTLLCLVFAGGAVTTLVWGGLFVAAATWRVPFLFTARPAERIAIVLYTASYGLWLASDALRVLGDPRPAGTVAATAELTALVGSAIFCAVIMLAVFLRGRPRLETWLDAAIFVAALAPALWLGFLAPYLELASAPWIAAWAAVTVGLLFTGSLYVMSGGIWNGPSIMLAVGVVANIATDLALRAGDATAPSASPHFLGGVMAGVYVALHPALGDVFVRGGRPAGIPLDDRVWMLVAALALPIGVLGWTYVEGDPSPILLIASSVGVMAAIVAVRAVFLMRTGVEHWSVPLTISLTALLVAATAVTMSSLNLSAQRAQDNVDRTAALLPTVRQLDGLLLRAARPGDPASAAARQAWSASIDRLRGSDADTRASLIRYVTAASPALDAADRGATREAQQLIDGPAAAAQRALAGRVDGELAERRAAASARAQRVRLFSVSMLGATLFVVAGLLLRFNAARRRVDLLRQATHDELTGLSNRAALDRELAKPIPVSAHEHGRALVMLDLDDFKAINDSLGRRAGDAVITAVARRLEEGLRSDHMVVRLDGDAFAVLVPPGADALIAAQRMLATLATEIALEDGPRVVHGSIGVAEVDETGDDRAATAFRDAELAMYQAKRVAGNSIERYSSDINERVRGRLQLLAELREALDGDGGLYLAYQPIVDLHDGGVVGYEALIRWNSASRGPLSPADFIPAAEESGLIVELGGWVLREATAQLATWQRDWQDDRYVSVNVAAAQFTTGAIVAQLHGALRDSGLAPEHLLLEVTESTLMEDLDVNVAQLEDVRALGVRVALDDFGTGYSSLSYLRRFPVDVVKIDKAFVDALDDPDGALLMRAIVDMATSLRLRVVAEGIEQLEQAAVLQQFGCQLGQGYHFSRPMPALQVLAGAPRFTIPATSQLRALP